MGFALSHRSFEHLKPEEWKEGALAGSRGNNITIMTGVLRRFERKLSRRYQRGLKMSYVQSYVSFAFPEVVHGSLTHLESSSWIYALTEVVVLRTQAHLLCFRKAIDRFGWKIHSLTKNINNARQEFDENSTTPSSGHNWPLSFNIWRH